MTKMAATETTQQIIDPARSRSGGGSSAGTRAHVRAAVRALRIHEGAAGAQPLIITRQTFSAHEQGQAA